MWSGASCGISFSLMPKFGLSDRLGVHLDHVRIPAGNGSGKTKGRSMTEVSVIKKRFVNVKAAFLFLAHALIIAIAKVNGDPQVRFI